MKKKHKPELHTIHRWAQEFGIGREKLTKRVLALGLGPRTHYTTQEICRAVYDDYDLARMRLTKIRAEGVAFRNEQTRKMLVNAKEVNGLFVKAMGAIRKLIAAEPRLEAEDKAEIIRCVDDAVAIALSDEPYPSTVDDAATGRADAVGDGTPPAETLTD